MGKSARTVMTSEGEGVSVAAGAAPCGSLGFESESSAYPLELAKDYAEAPKPRVAGVLIMHGGRRVSCRRGMTASQRFQCKLTKWSSMVRASPVVWSYESISSPSRFTSPG